MGELNVMKEMKGRKEQVRGERTEGREKRKRQMNIKVRLNL